MPTTQYRIYCKTEGKWITTTGTPALTCPTNSSHSVDKKSMQDLGKISTLDNSYIISVYPFLYSVNAAATYTATCRFIYFGSSSTSIVKIEAVAYKDPTATTFDIKVINLTNSLTIAEVLAQTASTSAIIDLGTIANIPTTKTMLEVQVRRNGTGTTLKAYITNLVLYCI